MKIQTLTDEEFMQKVNCLSVDGTFIITAPDLINLIRYGKAIIHDDKFNSSFLLKEHQL
jgi:hypothetical protein